MGKAENRYSGIPTIRYAMKKQGLPSPVFEDSRGEFSVVLYDHSVPANAEAEKPAAGLEDQVQDEKGLLEFCRVPRTRKEIIDFLGIASGQYALKRYLDPLVQAGAIRLTMPETPRSPRQQYFTAEKRL